MSVTVRRIRSTPFRTADETWATVVDLLAPEPGDARVELESIAGVASSLIASESTRDAAIACRGDGPRVRIYCLFGEAAVLGDNAEEASLTSQAASGDWALSLPAPTEDLDWVQRSLAKRTKRVTARDASEKLGPASWEKRSESNQSAAATIDTEAFFRS